MINCLVSHSTRLIEGIVPPAPSLSSITLRTASLGLANTKSPPSPALLNMIKQNYLTLDCPAPVRQMSGHRGLIYYWIYYILAEWNDVKQIVQVLISNVSIFHHCFDIRKWLVDLVFIRLKSVDVLGPTILFTYFFHMNPPKPSDLI